MGSHPNIDIDKFPQQGVMKDRRVKVCFNYDTSRTINGIIVRDDEEEPGLLLIKLDDGRYVKATECQYTFVKEEIERPSSLLMNDLERMRDSAQKTGVPRMMTITSTDAIRILNAIEALQYGIKMNWTPLARFEASKALYDLGFKV